MICALQAICFIAGIIILVKGKFVLTKGNEIVGVRARLIGGVLAAWLPLALAIGMAIGVSVALQNPNRQQAEVMKTMMGYWWVDVLIAILVFATVVAIAVTSKKQTVDQSEGAFSPAKISNPIDPENPYEPPTSRPL